MMENRLITVGSNSHDKVKTFKYLGSLLTNPISTHEEIKCRPKKEIYVIIQSKDLSSRLPSKNLKIKTFKTILFPLVLYSCETWNPALREEFRQRIFESRILRPKRDENWGGKGSTMRNFIVNLL